ncbi:Rab3 GTPase-activating protein catalytic subunit [Mortierella sp. GBA30]|nr:Rab3 GTPase-activating protein catalytic subunit [Mortierella sp. GBA30]
MDFFIERMGIEDDDPTASPGNHSQSTKEQIYVSALFSYDLMNWGIHESLWCGPEYERHEDAGKSAFEVADPSAPIWAYTGPSAILASACEVWYASQLARAQSTEYLDSKNFADMDASHANIWILHAAFKGDDYGILSGILEDAISSWSSEPEGGRHGDRKSDKSHHAYGSLLNKGARLIQGTITMVDVVDVENIVDALFEPCSISRPSYESSATTSSDHTVRLVPTSELGLHFRHATTVPYNSFLWKMIQYLVDVISPSSDISYATSIMGFLKVLWSELLKQFYSRWENSELIPSVDIYGDGYGNSDPKQRSTPDSNASAENGKEKKPVAIDLRYNMLHQKLSMLNSCIARQIARNNETPGHIHPVSIRRKDKDKDRGISASDFPENTSAADEPTYGAQLQNLLHGFSDIPRPKSADVVPMAKRLLETVKSRRTSSTLPSPQQDLPSISSSTSGVSSHRSQTRTEPSSPTASVPIPNRDMFRNRRRSSQNFRYRTSGRHVRESTLGSDDEDDIFYDPLETTESILDEISEDMIQRRHQSLTESFVALKYSSSADSQSGILVNDIDQMSVNSRGPDPREVIDETKSEGGLQPLKDLKLLETGAPLMIPKLQEPGYMTEDMIQQQEELFETLGSSSDGAKMRAKMQSTQLISDMEAFKAANPGCVLGDFIRWHSPKDWAEDKGQMSARMADAGNYWQELWANSKRIPVSRQTPLFNHNQEAAKALYYLDSLSTDQLFVLLLPTICLLAYDTLISHPVALHIRQVALGLRELGQELTAFSWNDLTGGEDLNLDVILDKFREVELLMGRAIALVRKFPDQYSLVERILEDHETVVEDGAERECVYDLFSIGGSLQSSFPQPTSREFVLETYDPAKASISGMSSVSESAAVWDSRPLQRRMYACFRESELRIVDAVAKDGIYM